MVVDNSDRFFGLWNRWWDLLKILLKLSLHLKYFLYFKRVPPKNIDWITLLCIFLSHFVFTKMSFNQQNVKEEMDNYKTMWCQSYKWEGTFWKLAFQIRGYKTDLCCKSEIYNNNHEYSIFHIKQWILSYFWKKSAFYIPSNKVILVASSFS